MASAYKLHPTNLLADQDTEGSKELAFLNSREYIAPSTFAAAFFRFSSLGIQDNFDLRIKINFVVTLVYTPKRGESSLLTILR